jgi:hypothetical protein
MKRLSVIFLMIMSGTALAQTTGTVNPSGTLPDPSVKEDVPPGGCMPIGMTASGEFVFPIQCKEFIERERGKTVEQKPAESPLKPAAAVEEKPAAKQSEGEASENGKPAAKPIERITSPKRVENRPRERPDESYCSEHYRSYDRASGTYKGYDGERHPCR